MHFPSRRNGGDRGAVTASVIRERSVEIPTAFAAIIIFLGETGSRQTAKCER